MQSSPPESINAAEIEKLADQSLWLSRHEKALLLAETDGFPPYLKELACGALRAEEQYRQQLAQDDPDLLQYLIDLKAWFAKDDRTAADFPGWRGCWDEVGQVSQAESPAQFAPTATQAVEDVNLGALTQEDTVVMPDAAPDQFGKSSIKAASLPDRSPPAPPLVSKSDTAVAEWRPSAWQMPVDSALLSLLSIHPLSEFDEANFLRLLSGSLSLSVAEKRRVIDAVPTLSQFKIDELTKVFVDEQQEFTKLLAKEGDIIRELDDKCNKEMEVLKTLYALEASASDVIDDVFLVSYLSVETMLLRFEFEQADTLAQTAFDANQFFSYEQCLKTHKALGQLDTQYLHTLIQHAVSSQVPGLVDAVRVLIECEQTDGEGIEQLWQRLQAFRLDGGMEWVPYYLRSRFHAFIDTAENAFGMAQDQIALAFGLLAEDEIASKGPMLLHFKRCLLLKGGEDTFSFMQTEFGGLDSYLSEMSWLLGVHLQEQNLVDVENDLIEYLRQYLKQSEIVFDVILKQPTAAPGVVSGNRLQEHLATFEQALSDMGIDWQPPELYKNIDIALADNNLADAGKLLDTATLQSDSTSYQKLWLWGRQVLLWRRQGKLADEITHLQNAYAATPSALHAWRLLIALHEVGKEGRAGALHLAQDLALKFCYLPVFQNRLFVTYHYLYTKNIHPPAAKQALWRAMAIGPTAGMFYSIAEYYRWQKGGNQQAKTLTNGIAVLAGVLEGTLGSTEWGMGIICAFRAGWHHLGWALFLLAGHTQGHNSDIYNDLAIGVANAANRNLDRTLFALAATTHAANRHPELNAIYCSNTTNYFEKLPTAVALNWRLYRATLAIWHTPEHTWIQYNSLLKAARQLERQDLYLPAYYVGCSLGAEINLANESPRHILAPLFHDGRMRMPESRDTAYLCFLAWAIAQESKWLGEHCRIAAPWHWIYELLRKVETLSANITTPGFLAGEAQRRQRELCLRPEWLLLRWPLQTRIERQQYRATELAHLAQDFPLANYQHNLDQDATDSQRRQLYRALSGGRIAHSHQTTINRLLPEWRKVVERCVEARFSARSQEKQITALADGHQLELLRQLVRDHESTLRQFSAEVQQQILRDWHLAIASSNNQAQLLAKLEQIANNYAQSGDLASGAALSSAANNFINAIEQTYTAVETLQKDLQQEYERLAHVAFALVLKHHALAGSEMFESFRTRIRHGWLISSLKDCFARFDLYNESDDDTILTPSMAQAMAELVPQLRQGLEQVVAALRTEFRHLVEQLDKHWLWLKDEQHPQGLLDFDIGHFDTLTPFSDGALLAVAPELLISDICHIIDQHANSRFALIREFLQQELFTPLSMRLDDIARWLHQTRAAINALPNGTHEYARLFGKIDDARKEFAKQMDDYCAWFNFQEHGVRDFTLSEIAHMAWQVVMQIDGTRLQTAKINTPVWIDTLPPCWLPGQNFSDLLEAFKVLLQNVVYHARPANDVTGLPVDITLTLAQRTDGRLSCQIASTCFASERIDCASLANMLADPAQRHARMQGKQGSGLASTQEILQHRLHGITGELLGPRLEPAANGTTQFVIDMVLQVTTPGEKPEFELAHLAIPDIKRILAEVATKKVRVLIAEDQPPKFEALSVFIRKLLPDCGIVMADDLETTARLLSSQDNHFDLLLLDMTLPEDPLPDAPLKSLAGLDVLKLMQIHAIHIPTVMVTQYNNWGDEALQNTRQFIEDLQQSCSRDFPQQFRGAVRFSHTDLAWQAELRVLIEAIFNLAAQPPLDAASVAKRLAQDPNDRMALGWQAHHFLEAGKCREALAILLRLQLLDPNQATLHADLACAYAGLGQQTEAQQALKAYQDLGGPDANSVHEQMLQGQIQWLKTEQQRLRQDEMMATLGQIAGGMSHEFSSPMAAIQTQVDFARRYLLKDAPQEAKLRDALNEIERQKVRMAAIVTHLRSLARGDKISVDQVDLGQIVRNALALQQSQMDSHAIVVQLEIPQHLPSVLANALVLEQVFINLLLNARDALDTSKVAEKTINITIKPLAKNKHAVLQVRVTDNGPGVPEDVRDKLFEPFFTTKDPGQGLGLGLSLARKGVSEYGGVIYLENPATGGASFVVELPVLEETHHET